MELQNIQSKNITFVIQGPESPVIQESINNILKYFPESKIILSSTSSYNSEYPNADLIIVSSDPGAINYSNSFDSRLNNINRQIVSTFAGLEQVKTEFVFKLRADFLLTGSSFLDFFDKYEKNVEGYKIFKHKILACSYFTRNPKSYQPYPFHISDLIFFGYLQDVKKLYDIPLMPKEEERFIIKGKSIWCRYMPEQYLLLNCLKKNNFNFHCNYFDFCTPENILETEKIFCSNFILLNFKQLCVSSTKDTFIVKKSPRSFASCYTPNEWLGIYKKYCEPNLIVNSFDEERTHINKYFRKYKYYNLLAKLLTFWIPVSDTRKFMRHRIIDILK